VARKTSPRKRLHELEESFSRCAYRKFKATVGEVVPE
jgi:hypothetical protein